MNNEPVMGGGEAVRNLEPVIGGLANRDGAFGKALAQRLALQQLRDDVRRSAFETDVVNSKNTRMVQRGGGAGFLFEAAQMIGIVAGGRANQLQRDVAAQALVARAKDFAHPPCADSFEDPVVPHELACHKQLHEHALHGMLGASAGTVKAAERPWRWQSRGVFAATTMRYCSSGSACYNLCSPASTSRQSLSWRSLSRQSLLRQS